MHQIMPSLGHKYDDKFYLQSCHFEVLRTKKLAPILF